MFHLRRSYSLEELCGDMPESAAAVGDEEEKRGLWGNFMTAMVVGRRVVVVVVDAVVVGGTEIKMYGMCRFEGKAQTVSVFRR